MHHFILSIIEIEQVQHGLLELIQLVAEHII